MARRHTPEEIVRKLARESSLFIVVEGEGAVLSEGAAPREVSAPSELTRPVIR